MYKKIIAIIMALSISIVTASCQNNNSGTNNSTSTAKAAADILSSINISPGENETVGEAGTFIELGANITVNGQGAAASKGKVTITSAGTYRVKGTLADGQIIVNAGNEDKVYIILNSVNINSSSSAPVYVMNSKKTIVSLDEGTENIITSTAAASENEPDAAVFSKSDLVLTGKGTLNVKSENGKGIVSKDDLRIENGNITVNSKKDGIKGKDSVVVIDGNITVNSEEDGIVSNNDTDKTKGYILIQNGKISITSGQDGIQGETNVFVKSANITVISGGGSKNGEVKTEQGPFGPPIDNQTAKSSTTSTKETPSAKGVKAGTNIVIEGGNFNIDSADDAFHSNNNLVINAGTFKISSGDDGLHADTTLTVNDGTIDIIKAYEGIESKVITLNKGDVSVVSSDDGINASDGSGQSSNGRPGQNNSASNGVLMNINGGYIAVDAGGDGVDSNGSINMAGGTVLVNGPTDDGNGALDYNGTFKLTGGTLVAAGSSGMAEAPGDTSTENSVKIFLAQQAAGTIVHVEGSDGKEIVTFAPSKQYSSVVVASSELKKGQTYKVYVGGSSTGKEVDGVYAGGAYTKGQEAADFTVSGAVTEVIQAGVTVNTRGPGMGHGKR